MTPGQILLKLYHQPLGRVRASLRNGGPIAERETERQRCEMVLAAAALPPLPKSDQRGVAVHLMTGCRFWYQTVFCLHSLARQLPKPLSAELYDDGSLGPTETERLERLGPTIRIHRHPELLERLEQHLPRKRYPMLRDRWDHYPNIRKLIDVHLGSNGWKLVLDSDLLFFRRPDALIHWLVAPDRILHAIDCEESYGYSRSLLERLAGASLPRRLNVGVCGLRSDALDWDQLEAWTAELQRLERTNYYLEQALVAMLAARQPAIAVPADDYITLPSRDEVRQPVAVMHHYVDTAKRWYFRYGWRHVVHPPPRA